MTRMRGMWVVALVLVWGFAHAGEAPPVWAQLDRGTRISDEGPRVGVGSKIALYPINRLQDLMDVASLQLGFGFGLHANFHATRAVQFGGGASAVSRVGFEGRGIGLCNEAKAELSLLMFSIERFSRSNAFGTYNSYQSPRDLPWLYLRHRDYWGIGGEVSAAIVNFGFELHPAELPDLLVGLAAVDLRHDDLPQPPKGKAVNLLRTPEGVAVKRVVIVPSRVVAARSVRMARPSGLGVYYNRFGSEATFGLVGTAFSGTKDQRAATEFNAAVARQRFDLYAEMLERLERVVYLRRGWKVADTRKTLAAFRDHAVTKKWGDLTVQRLPNYAGLCQAHGADTVLDVRIWEWGVWRNSFKRVATMRLDCEFKLIAYPANKVLLDLRLASDVKEKKGFPLADFARDDGRILVEETRDAIGVVTAAFADIVREAEQ